MPGPTPDVGNTDTLSVPVVIELALIEELPREVAFSDTAVILPYVSIVNVTVLIPLPYVPGVMVATLGSRVAFKLPVVTADASILMGVGVTDVIRPNSSTFTTGISDALPYAAAVTPDVGKRCVLMVPLDMADASTDIGVEVAELIRPYASTVITDTLVADPYVAAPTPESGNLVTFRVPLVTEVALIAIAVLDTVVTRPYWSTVTTGTLVADPYVAAPTPDRGNLVTFRVPLVTAVALIAIDVLVTVVTRPY